MDAGCERFKTAPMTAVSPKDLPETEYDVVVITIKNPSKANEVKEELVEAGVPEHKIRWFEQKELYWKYAEVCGWIK